VKAALRSAQCHIGPVDEVEGIASPSGRRHQRHEQVVGPGEDVVQGLRPIVLFWLTDSMGHHVGDAVDNGEHGPTVASQTGLPQPGDMQSGRVGAADRTTKNREELRSNHLPHHEQR